MVKAHVYSTEMGRTKRDKDYYDRALEIQKKITLPDGCSDEAFYNLAYAFIEPDLAAEGTRLAIDVLGQMVQAHVIKPGPYDPGYTLVRS